MNFSANIKMVENALCPICLDAIDADDCIAMPVCGHRVHTVCALNAAQYDVRCPVCRYKDERVLVRPTNDDMASEMFRNLEALVERQTTAARAYSRRKSQVIQRCDSLRRIRDQLKIEQRCFLEADRQLDRKWADCQRTMWMTDANIVAIKAQRTRFRRRMTALNRRLALRLEPLIGLPPDAQAETRFVR